MVKNIISKNLLDFWWVCSCESPLFYLNLAWKVFYYNQNSLSRKRFTLLVIKNRGFHGPLKFSFSKIGYAVVNHACLALPTRLERVPTEF